MTRRRNLAIAGAVVVGLGAIGVAVLPGIVQARVRSAIDAMLAETVDADVSVGQVDVSLFRTFPTVSVSVTDVVVSGRDAFQGIELANLPRVELGIDLLSAIGGSTLTIARASSTGGHVHVVVAEDGRPNWDVLPESDGEDTATLDLDHVVIADLGITYEDRGAELVTEVEDIDATASARLTQSVAHVDTHATIASLTMRYAGVTWLRATRWDSQMLVDIDQQTGAVTFGDNQVRINELPLTFRGLATPTDDSWDVDLGVEATDTSFAALLSLVPDAYSDSFADVNASGQVAFAGTIDGVYDSTWETLPSFDVELDVQDGRFQFPDLPTAVDRVATRIEFSHPGGDRDRVRIDAKHFELAVGGAALRGRLAVEHPTTDPDLDAMFDGRLDLGALRRALPEAAGAPEVDGFLDLDFTVDGRMSDFQERRVERVHAGGSIRGRGLRFDWDQEPVEIDRIDVVLSPSRTTVNELALRSMGSDVRISGNLDDLFPWLLADADLSGALGLRSGQIDLRPFQGESDRPSDDGLLFAVPEGVVLGLTAELDRVLTDAFTMRDVTGSLDVRGGVMTLKRLNGRMLGGDVTLSGTYAADTVEQAEVDLKIETNRTDLGDTLATFETLAVVAPVLKRAVGAYDSSISVSATLGRDGSPDLSAVTSFGDLSPRNMRVQTATLNTIATQLKNDELAALDLAATRLAYFFEKGRVDLKPFTARMGKQRATISGSFGPLDKTLDLGLDIPIETRLIRGAKVLGALGDALPKTADVQVEIGGTFDKPRVKIGLGGTFVDEAVDAALDPLVAAATAEGDKLLAEARAAADKLLAEAQKAADALIAEAKKKARKLRRDARGKPLEEVAAEAAAKLLENEADKAADKVLAQAEKAADKLVDEAKKKRDQLVGDATAGVKKKLR